MKILYLPSGLPMDYTIQLATAMSKSCEVSVLLFNTESTMEKLKDIDISKKINLILTKKFKKPIYHPYNIITILSSLKEIRSYDFDIIHVQSGDIPSILISIASRKSSLVTTFHDVRIHPGNENLIQKTIRFYFKRFSKAIFVHGEKLKEILKREIHEEKIHVIPMPEHNTKPIEKYVSNNMDNVKKEDIILFFGWIAYHKGIEYLIEASELVKKDFPQLKVIIAGEVGKGKYDLENFKECKQMIKNKDYFELYPYHIPWDFASLLFKRSKIVILPYRESSQSGVIPVAYNFRVPVIATDVGALSEIVDDGETGYIVPPKDVGALSSMILKLLKDENLRKTMGKKGYKKLKEDMSWETVAKKTMSIYTKINSI